MKLFSLPHALGFPLIVIVALFCKVNSALAQASNIIPDNTLGDENSQVIENADGQPNEVITGGAQREQNLFHSFQEFNVSEGRGAFFANPEAVNNIFSRVTGSNPSNILGALGVNGAANLYLINPNGIVFGENSSLDVQGSFTATTGNGIRFGEQGEFNTVNPQTPQLLTINPSAYLFDRVGDGDINSIESQGSLQVPEGEHLVLLGGDISLQGGILVAPGGTVELGSVNDPGEIVISEDENLVFPDEVARGDISLEGLSIFVFGVGEGFINVNSQNLNLTEGSQMVAGIFQGLGDSDTVGGDIVIDVLGTVSLDGSRISNTIAENAEGTTGKIEVEAESLVLQNGGLITANTFARGNAGDIEINATDSVILDGRSSDGISGNISSDVSFQGEGNAGNIEITTASLEVINGAAITANTLGTGNAGNITITATDSMIANGPGSAIISSVFQSAIGNGGKITITTPSVEISNNTLIASNTFRLGNGGEIEIYADVVLLKDSEIRTSSNAVAEAAGDITLNVSDTLMLENSSINSSASRPPGSSSSMPSGGDITIIGGDIRLRDDSDITTNVGVGVGGGGDITITADSIIAFDDSDIFAFAQDEPDVIFGFALPGEGGNITLNTPVFFGENFTSNSLTSNPDLLDNNSRADLNATGAVSGEVSVPDVSFIQNSLSELPDNSLNTDELLANSCVVPAGDRERGRFVITGGESLPVRPGDNLPSRYPTTEVRNLPDNDNSWHRGDRIVEPQGAYRLTNGKLVLSRECF